MICCSLHNRLVAVTVLSGSWNSGSLLSDDFLLLLFTQPNPEAKAFRQAALLPVQNSNLPTSNSCYRPAVRDPEFRPWVPEEPALFTGLSARGELIWPFKNCFHQSQPPRRRTEQGTRFIWVCFQLKLVSHVFFWEYWLKSWYCNEQKSKTSKCHWFRFFFLLGAWSGSTGKVVSNILKWLSYLVCKQ